MVTPNRTLMRLLNVPGLNDRFNDLILSRNRINKSDHLIFFFHGDIQDYPERMSSNKNSKPYYRWNLEATASLLAEKFFDSVIVTIKASVIRLGVKASFDNFVETDLFGDPTFELDTRPLAHLQRLTDQVVQQSDWLQPIKCIRLIGFSQGMTVVNQLIHSLHVLDQSPDTDLEPFAELIKHIYWLDGGKCWLTDEKIISTLKGRNIVGHVHATPFQVYNPDRPENQINYKIFKSHLDAMNVNHVDKVSFKDSKPSINNHFQLLSEFDP